MRTSTSISGHHVRNRKARRASRKAMLGVVVAAAGLAVAGLGPMNADAAEPTASDEVKPTDQELLSQCDRADVCTYTPTSTARFVGDLHQVGSAIVNCEDTDVSRTITWSDTTNSSVSVDVSLSIGGGFGEAINVAFQSKAGISFGQSHTTSESVTQTVPAWYKAEIVRGTAMVSVTGDWHLNFPDRFFGHYKWKDENITFTEEDTNSPSDLIFRARPLTDEEISTTCRFNGVVTGRGQASIERVISAANPESGSRPSGGSRLSPDEPADQAKPIPTEEPPPGSAPAA